MDGSSIVGVAVDDEEINLHILQASSRAIGIELHAFQNPLKALEFIRQENVDIIFTDHFMSEMNGIDLIRAIHPEKNDIPIIMITAFEESEDLKREAIRAGATDFLNKPLNLAEFGNRVNNLLELKRAQNHLRQRALTLEDEVRRATKDILEREIESLTILARVAEYRDAHTSEHITRVSVISHMIAERIGLGSEEREVVRQSSLLHDIGKIGIPDSVLMKEGPLTPEERKIIENHTHIGFDILKTTKSRYLQAGALIAISHHECFDGSGYPAGLSGEKIPLYGRIVAVADVYDALISRRPYKKAWSSEEARNYIRERSRIMFDPLVVDRFLSGIETLPHSDL